MDRWDCKAKGGGTLGPEDEVSLTTITAIISYLDSASLSKWWQPCKPSPSSERWRWFVGFVGTLPVMKPSREPLLTSTGANIKLVNLHLCLFNQNIILTMITRGSLFLEPIPQDGRLWHGKTRNGIFQWGLQGYTQGEHLLVWPFINIENCDKSNPNNKISYSWVSC